jgi:ribose transport system ATP-binding protein
MNTAADINSTAPYTLLSVAAAIIGGCSLTGGLIGPLGTVSGALTLSLVSTLLGLLEIGIDYSPMIQGGVLIAILMIRTLFDGAEA